MNSVLTVAALAAILHGTDAGVCQETMYPACEAMGCGPRQGNACQEPPECSPPTATIQYMNRNTGVVVNRAPVSPAIAELCNTDNECSAMYTVNLNRDFTTGGDCNDIGMLPPHGVDQTECRTNEVASETETEMWAGANLRNYVNHPYPNDGIKQSLAAAERSVTALTESSENCATSQNRGGNQNCAFPLGFKTDTILKHLGICVKVVGAEDKWVEILGSSMEGSNGGSYCVRDRNAGANLDGETGCTVSGDLIDIRESGNRPEADAVTGTNDNMNIIFYAQDNTDDAAIKFQWRVVASYIKPTNVVGNAATGEQRDAEDWSMSRDGAGYPNSLMSPYPANFEGNPVFETTTESSGSWTAPALQLVLALVAMTAILL